MKPRHKYPFELRKNVHDGEDTVISKAVSVHFPPFNVTHHKVLVLKSI